MSKSKVIEVTIPREKVDYIESIAYEVEARKDIISFMLERGMDISTSAFKKYQTEHSEYFASFEIAKKEIEKEFMPKELDGRVSNWNLDYSTGIMTFTFDGENNSCLCK